jgi:putative PIN family toxin of toxin-antitoxin system
LADVLSSSRFDRYVSVEERQQFMRLSSRVIERVEAVHVARACRDLKDDKFLEVAANGSADVIVTGTAYLVALHPFRGSPVIMPAALVAGWSS